MQLVVPKINLRTAMLTLHGLLDHTFITFNNFFPGHAVLDGTPIVI